MYENQPTNAAQIEKAIPEDTEIAGQLSQLERSQQELWEEITQLASRLQPVLIQRPQEAGGKTGHTSDAHTILGREIERRYDFNNQCREAIQYLLENLAL